MFRLETKVLVAIIVGIRLDSKYQVHKKIMIW